MKLGDEQLSQLLASLEALKQTSAGTADLQRRIKLFGDCQRIDGETSGQYYSRPHQLSSRRLPPTKSPL